MSALWTRRSGIQLAYPFELKRLIKFPSPWLVQPKLNGERCRAIIGREEVTLLSSEENVIHTLPHINAQLMALELPYGLELDGEIYVHGMSKQTIGSFMRRKLPALHHEVVEYHIFDLVQAARQVERLNMLYTHFAPLFRTTTNIQVVDTHKIYAHPNLLDLLSAYVSEGYEGIVIRNSQAIYERKRTTNMLKWKPKHFDSYLIIDTEEEVDKFGIPKDTLGAFVCIKDEQPFNVSAAGLTREDKKRWWLVRNTIPGKWLLCKYPELTDRGIPNHAVVVDITDMETKEND